MLCKYAPANGDQHSTRTPSLMSTRSTTSATSAGPSASESSQSSLSQLSTDSPALVKAPATRRASLRSSQNHQLHHSHPDQPHDTTSIEDSHFKFLGSFTQVHSVEARDPSDHSLRPSPQPEVIAPIRPEQGLVSRPYPLDNIDRGLPGQGIVEAPLIQYHFVSTATSPVLQPTKGNFESRPEPEWNLPDNEYWYMEIKPNQVRLLLLHMGQESDPIHCSLKTIESKNLGRTGLAYQALSYAWGSPVGSQDIFLRDIDIPILRDNTSEVDYIALAASRIIPRRFYIRPNLYHALKRLRSRFGSLWLWIDAICIDQDSHREKTHQLSKMLDIYCKSSNVAIWIGENELSQQAADASVGEGMEFVRSLINLSALDRIISNHEMSEAVARSCSAFAALLRRDWFGRRWVIQEVSAASRASIQCGSHRMNWIDFADAVELFVTNIEKIRSLYKKTETGQRQPDALRHVESMGAKVIVSSMSNVVRKDHNGGIVDRPLQAESLVLNFIHFDASDPRDTVYALLALASDGQFASLNNQPTALYPDYKKTPVQVYMEFVRHCIATKRSLDILCRNWALPITGLTFRWAHINTPSSVDGTAKKVLPTWIGIVANSAFGPPSGFTGRLNGDSLVGLPGKPIYNASHGSRMAVKFEEQQVRSVTGSISMELTGALHVDGITIGKVTRVTSRVVDDIISDDCLEMLGWHKGNDVNTIPDILWRTLVANRDDNGQSPPSWYRRACMYCLRKTTAEGDLNTAKLLEHNSLPSTVLQFLRRVQSVVWSRRFLLCEDTRKPSSKLSGLGSRYAKEGDLVCILYGCSVPVLLRYLSAPQQYGLVGECYIHGEMDGESIVRRQADSIGTEQTKAFQIV
ncbi:HET-domain-containing protein [Paramyrothecium foliicola]|nr:HET-domain-containing protein [Paramyrothecium foliicola]